MLKISFTLGMLWCGAFALANNSYIIVDGKKTFVYDEVQKRSEMQKKGIPIPEDEEEGPQSAGIPTKNFKGKTAGEDSGFDPSSLEGKVLEGVAEKLKGFGITKEDLGKIKNLKKQMNERNEFMKELEQGM